MKTGLIMEGGAMRGLFTAGVIDVFMENGIEFDAAIGVSAGAAFGCNYKSRQPGRVIRYNKRFAKDPRFCSIRSLIRTGDLFGAEFITLFPILSISLTQKLTLTIPWIFTLSVPMSLQVNLSI